MFFLMGNDNYSARKVVKAAGRLNFGTDSCGAELIDVRRN